MALSENTVFYKDMLYIHIFVYIDIYIYIYTYIRTATGDQQTVTTRDVSKNSKRNRLKEQQISDERRWEASKKVDSPCIKLRA